MTRESTPRLRIAIQKSGRLTDNSLDLLARCGLRFSRASCLEERIDGRNPYQRGSQAQRLTCFRGRVGGDPVRRFKVRVRRAHAFPRLD